MISRGSITIGKDVYTYDGDWVGADETTLEFLKTFEPESPSNGFPVVVTVQAAADFFGVTPKFVGTKGGPNLIY